MAPAAQLALLIMLVPGVADALQQPITLQAEEAFNSLGSQVPVLRERLLAARNASFATIRNQKEEDEAKLQVQRDELRSVELVNRGIAADFVHVRSQNEVLRCRANNLTALIRRATAALHTLRENVTVAGEFSDRSLLAAKFRLEKSPELSILAELDETDAAAAQENAHAERMKGLAMASLKENASKDRMGLVQVSTGRRVATQVNVPVRPDATKAMVNTLLASWKEMSKEQNATLHRLSFAFSQAFSAGEVRRATLLADQGVMNTTLKEAKQIGKDLAAAVAHLEATLDTIGKGREALSVFGARLATKHLPIEALNPEEVPQQTEEKKHWFWSKR